MARFIKAAKTLRPSSKLLLIVGCLAIIAAASGASAGFVSYRGGHSAGYDSGFEAGKAEGYSKAKKEGAILAVAEYKRGYEDGVIVGAGQGWDAGWAAGKLAGIEEAADEAATAGFNIGYEMGYNAGYNVAVENAITVLKERLPGILQASYSQGYADGSSQATTTVVLPSLDLGFGSIHCTALEVGSATFIDCY